MPALSDGVNIPGAGTDWSTGANPSVTLIKSGGSIESDFWANNYSFIAGYTYEFTLNVDYAFHANVVSSHIYFVVLDNSNNVLLLIDSGDLGNASGTYVGPLYFIAPIGATKYALKGSLVAGLSTTSTIDIDTITATQTTPATPAVEPQIITEQLCIEVIEECNMTFINDNYRQTEGNNLRALE